MAHNFDASATAAPRPRKPLPPAAVQNRLPHTPTPRFWLRAHPQRWQCIDGEWLPLLGSLKHDLGVGGVDKMGNTDHAQIDSEKRGWKVIPWDCTPDGELYIDEYDCNGGVYCCTRWESPRHLAGKPLPSKVDETGYRDWLRWLVANGHVPEPDPEIVDMIQLEQQRKRVQNLAKETHKPGVNDIYQVEKQRLEMQEHATEALRGKASTKRAPRRKPAPEAGE